MNFLLNMRSVLINIYFLRDPHGRKLAGKFKYLGIHLLMLYVISCCRDVSYTSSK